jgi:hypothetical protein
MSVAPAGGWGTVYEPRVRGWVVGCLQARINFTVEAILRLVARPSMHLAHHLMLDGWGDIVPILLTFSSSHRPSYLLLETHITHRHLGTLAPHGTITIHSFHTHAHTPTTHGPFRTTSFRSSASSSTKLRTSWIFSLLSWISACYRNTYVHKTTVIATRMCS